jgi:hypothetical protein
MNIKGFKMPVKKAAAKRSLATAGFGQQQQQPPPPQQQQLAGRIAAALSAPNPPIAFAQKSRKSLKQLQKSRRSGEAVNKSYDGLLTSSFMWDGGTTTQNMVLPEQPLSQGFCGHGNPDAPALDTLELARELCTLRAAPRLHKAMRPAARHPRDAVAGSTAAASVPATAPVCGAVRAGNCMVLLLRTSKAPARAGEVIDAHLARLPARMLAVGAL